MALRLLVAGASGAVGSEVLRLALASPEIARVCAPTRRPLAVRSPRLDNPQIDFAKLPARAPWWGCDAVICALGTTIRTAGSKDAFAAIDRDLPISVGRLALKAGATRYALNSSLGASADGNFYLRTKWEAEQGLAALGFTSLTVVRPSLIDTRREQPRPAEQAGIIAARLFRPLIPRHYRSVTPEQIARALLAGVIDGHRGVTVVESEALQAG